jgi:glutamine amidotransferase
MKGKIIIVDYNVGNTNSVFNAIKKLGYNVEISNKQNLIEQADALIMPGVGAFSEAISNIEKLNINKLLTDQVVTKKIPVLGICIGLQLMASSSEENGFHTGLGWIDGTVKKIPHVKNLRIPHVGWNEVKPIKDNDILFSNSTFENPSFYWDHSYYFDCRNEDRAGIVEYGIDITAVVRKDNIVGVQFHPEKSQNNGLRLFRSFFNYFNII